MAFGFTELNAGAGGSKVAGDFVNEGGQVKEFQRLKIVWGPEGTITALDSGAGAMPVQDGGNSITVDSLQLPAALVGGRLDVNIGAGSVSISGTVDTELPAAAALADATANPTTPLIGAALEGFNGATWDRLRSTTANGLVVDVSRVQGTVTVQDNASLVDNAAFTDGTSRVLMVAGIFDEVAGTALTENDAAAFRVDSKRAQILTIEDATTRGQRAAVSAGGALSVDTELPAAAALADNTANPTVPAVGAFLMGWDPVGANWDRLPVYVEDDASAANPTGFALMARRRDIPIATTEVSAAGDTIALNAANDGALWSRVPNKQTSASFTSTGTLDLDVTGMSEVYINITGTFVGTVQFIGDSSVALGVNPGILRAFNISTFALETQTTVPAKYFLPVGGLGSFRINVTAYTSGQIDVAISASAGSSVLHVTDGGGSLTVDGTVAVSGSVTVAQATAANLNAEVQGDAAHDAPRSGNPVRIGARASAAAPSDVSADDDTVDLWALRNGSLAVSLQSISSATNMDVTGVSANDAAFSERPVGLGVNGSTATPTAVGADGRKVRIWGTREGAVIVRGVPVDTPTQSSVASSASNVTLLAANTGRYGASISNDSTAVLFVKLGATASSSSYTVKLFQDGYYEVPFNYTGIIDGIWASATGNARITEHAI